MHTFGSRIAALLLTAIVCRGDAITQLSHFWESNISTVDRLLWDSHGNAHGMYIGRIAGLTTHASALPGGGYTLGDDAVYGALSVSVPSSLVDTSGTWCIAVWYKRNAGSNRAIVERSGSFGVDTGGTAPVLAYKKQDTTTSTVTSGTSVTFNATGLVWVAFDSATGEVMITANAGAWTKATPSSPFISSLNAPLVFGIQASIYNQGDTIGRSMMWKGYIPSDAERSAIYNGGSGRDYTYFNAAGFTKPSAPFTDVTLVNSTFADDANLTGQQGLYWLRPYNVCTMANNSFANGGNCYMWWRSTDHVNGDGGLYYGWSSGPDVLPSSWTLAKNASNLDADDPGTTNWDQLETPHMEWNADTSTWHLYAHAGINGSSPYDQATVLYTSTNLSTWTFNSVAMPVGATVDGVRINHTGYAQVRRTGPNQWVAQSLINDAVVGARLGMWSSTDGINWGTPTVTTCIDVAPFSGSFCNWQNYSGLASGALRGGPTNAAYMAAGSGEFSALYPFWLLFEHGGTQSSGDWLQDVRTYCEGPTCWWYAKWKYQEPATTKLYRGTISNWFRKRLDGAVILSGGARLQ